MSTKSSKIGSVLVVGGGIGGIQAALDLANSGFKTYVLEKQPAIGGVMAQLDKTFPTNDCSMCIMSPKLVDVGRHPNIELITYADIEDIKGSAGSFHVKINKKAGFIDADKCTGCGECEEVCPVTLDSEFDEGLADRHAIFKMYPQAVPQHYTIDKHGVQPCRDACPAGVGAPGYVALVSQGKFYQALQVIKERLPFPSICGRVCHRPCEEACSRSEADDPIGIAYLKRFVGDLELKIPAYQVPPVKGKAESVAIVGGGPAGLTAAHDLALKGYHVTIFEAGPVLGGMMRWGIPAFRLPKEILEREISDILALGVKVRLNTAIGKDFSIPDLFSLEYDSVLIAVGAQVGKVMDIPGEDLDGVYQAIDFLKEINLGTIITTPIATVDDDLCVGCGKCAPECIYGAIRLKKDKNDPKKKYPIIQKYVCKGCGKCAKVCPSKAIKLTGIRDVTPSVGKKVLVVGGGNAALDTARSAIRLGGEEVTILYRRSRVEMPAEPDWEIDETAREGVKFEYLTSPVELIGDEDGAVKAVKCRKMRLLEETDKSGRRKIEPIPDSEFIIDADSVILAIGQEVDSGFLSRDVDLEYTPYSSIKVDPLSFTEDHQGKLEYTPWSTIKIDRISHETSLNGVFCAGDAVWGAGTIIESIAAGKEAAVSIDRYLSGKDLKKGRDTKKPVAQISTENVQKKHMVPMRLLPIEDRKNNFKEVELGYSEEEAIEEARRCLNCGGCVECLECVRTCEADAIKHDMIEEQIDIDVGSVILAPGYELFDATVKSEYGYGRFPNVINSLEFERILSASGPYQGHVVRPSDETEPKKIAWIQCVGSRDNICGNNYCSSVCCTYAIKEAVIAKEHSPQIKPTIFYMDMRTYGKGFERYYNRAEEEHGIEFIRCRVSCVEQDQKTKNLFITYETEDGILKTEEYDMVVLSCGLSSQESMKNISERIGIDLNEFGFCETKDFDPIETTKEGIFVCGAFSGPKDIPETVIEASGAAAKASKIIASERNKLVEKMTYPPERDVSDEEPRIGLFICHCGINIGAYIDVPNVVEYAKDLPHVAYAEENLYTCSDDTQSKMVEKIKEHNLNRVIVASCTPRTHEPLFQATIREAGLNPHLFEMANIRDQCSWVHMKEPEQATEKAKQLVNMAVAKAALIEPLPTIEIDVTQKALVIGGGLAGMISALGIADQGFDVFLVEKENELGGNLRHLHWTLEGSDVPAFMNSVIENVKNHPKITVYKNATVDKVDGYIGNYETTIKNGSATLTVEHGVIIVATGAEESKPNEYLYGEDDRVLTQLDLEKYLAENISFEKETIVMIQCVGSRDETHPYCSRICCTDAIKNALKIKERHPDAQIFILYRDMRTYAFKETYYERAREQGILFVRYSKDNKPAVTKGKTDLKVRVEDRILGEDLLIHADHLVLSPAIVPRKDNEALAKQLKVPLNEDSFFLEAHVKLRPVDFATEGIFLSGMAHSPKSIQETIAQSYAAAARALTIISKDKYYTDAPVACVDEDLCSGCGVCLAVCPYNAIETQIKVIDGKEKKVSSVLEAICKGCGSCAAACPSAAIDQKGFRRKQISSMIDAAVA